MKIKTLSEGQRLLLTQLSNDARVWRTPRGNHLVSPYIPWATLTEGTVDALLAAGYLQLQESYGAESSVYILSPAGAAALAGSDAT
jgi:hypothetical protein